METLPAPLPPLACPVRDCAAPLHRDGRVWRCPQGHTFDVARRGYVNLLQPQDRKSSSPGDAKAVVDARARLIRAGIGTAAARAVAALATSRVPSGAAVIVELGSGTGDLLGPLVAGRSWCGIGIDLATAAVDHAARRFPQATWLVANADRRLPLLTASVDIVLSLHARRNPAECARILKPEGQLIVAIPAADDLIELRAAVQGHGIDRDRVPALVAEHGAMFTLEHQTTTRERVRVEPDLLALLLQTTYRGVRSREAARMGALEALDVTLASEVCVFRPRATSTAVT
jgi:23S rRNA (guanine745-N1)-methyltransferase